MAIRLQQLVNRQLSSCYGFLLYSANHNLFNAQVNRLDVLSIAFAVNYQDRWTTLWCSLFVWPVVLLKCQSMSAETNSNPDLKVIFSNTEAAHLSRKITGWHQSPETVMATKAQNSAQFMNIVQFHWTFSSIQRLPSRLQVRFRVLIHENISPKAVHSFDFQNNSRVLIGLWRADHNGHTKANLRSGL